MAEMSVGEFFESDSPEFRGLVKKSRDYFKLKNEKLKQLTLTGEPIKMHGFGRFSGLPPEIPTMNELAITQYLDKNNINYEKHATFEKLFPSEVPEHPDIEYDIYIPEKQIAIEISPKWHDPEKIKKYVARKDTPTDARKNLTRVLRNDALKAKLAKEHGIYLIIIDPTDNFNTFAERVNRELVPILRTSGYHVPNWYVQGARSRAVDRAYRVSGGMAG